jgi:hypothetical protein
LCAAASAWWIFRDFIIRTFSFYRAEGSINSNQFQDVAVIEVSKNSGEMLLSVIGDEDLYGKDYVVEPSIRAVSETPNPAYIGDRTIIVNNNVYGSGLFM